ncbi:MAG: DUF488 family protein [Acidobacteriota bacterium]|jgi:uncharacterized protein YeaO (DUF488 family)
MDIRTKRAYEDPSPEDGTRILVDRLWPRGVSKEVAKIDFWPKEIAPSNELRRWYHGNQERWEEFRTRYFAELDDHPDGLDELLDRVRQGPVTFVYSSKETEHNNARALREYVRSRL